MSPFIRSIFAVVLTLVTGCGGMSGTSGTATPIDVKPDSAAAAADELVRTRDFGGAMLIYRSVLDVDPGHVPSLRGMLRVASETGDAVTGAHYYAALADGGGLEPGDVLLMADLYTDSGDDAAALATLDDGTERFPGDADLLSALGLALVRTGQTAEARGRLEAAMSNGGEAGRNAHRALCDLLFEDGDYGDAFVVLEEYEARYPGDFSVNMRLAWICMERGDYESAVTYYRSAVDARPSSVDARVALATAYEKVGRTDSAIRSYDRAIEERGMVVEMAPVILAQANLLNRQGRFDLSLSLLEEAGDSFTLTPGLNCALGMALAGEGRYDDALGAFELAVHDRQYGDFARDQIRRVKGLRQQSR